MRLQQSAVWDHQGREGATLHGCGVELKVADIASHLGRDGVFFLPQASSGFRYSGAQCYGRVPTGMPHRLFEQTGIEFEIGVGIETSLYPDKRKNTTPSVEVACCDFDEAREWLAARQGVTAELVRPEAAVVAVDPGQLALL